MTVYLQTARLTLRRFVASDLDALIELDSDPEVMRYLGGRPTPPDEIRDRVLPTFLAQYEKWEHLGFWAAHARATGEFLGWFHFRPPHDDVPGMEVGYRLRRACWGQGLATEGTRALIRKGFEELGLERIIAKTLKDNRASQRVMEKAGMTYVGEFVEHRIDPPTPAVWYAIDRADYHPADSASPTESPGA